MTGGDAKPRNMVDPKNPFAENEESKEEVDEEEEQNENNEVEDWVVLKRCKGHRGTISDVSWSPDNLHFASCSTDSTICIWDVNENGKFLS